jgi:hypothetical protein
MPEYKIMGYDQFGNRVIETITFENVPWWKRSLLRIGRLFGIGRFKNIASIKIRD